MLPNLKKHISLQSNTDVLEICRPWFEKYNLNHLNYIRVYQDNSVFYLCNNHGWLERYYQENYPSIGAFEQKPELRKLKSVLWAGLDKDDKILYDTREMFNVCHGITLIEKQKNYWEFYNIGTSNTDPSILNFFINHYDVLKQFAAEFKAKSHRLMKISQAQRIQLQNSNKLDLSSLFTSNNITNATQQHDLRKLLTKTEIICMKLCAQGKSSREIAELLSVSNRTVEKHIENVKDKFECRKLFQLGYILAKLDIDIV